MKQYRNILVPALVAPALVAFATPAAELAFRPDAGATVTLTIEQTSEVTLDDMSIAVNGQEMDPAMMGGMEMTMSSTQTVTITDEFGAVEDGRPTKVKRTFDSLGGSTSMSMSNDMIGDTETDAESASELEGSTVKFEWNAENGEYDVSFDGDEGDEELLEGLEADLTLRAFLPDSEVSEGDSWEVDPEAMRSVLAPGGSLKLEPEETEEAGMMGAGPTPSPDQFLQDMEGSINATFKGMRDEDGVQVAVIAVEFNVASAADLTDMLADAMSENDMGMEIDIEAFDMEFSYEGEGEIHWNVQAGVVHGCEISGEVELVIDQAMNMGGTPQGDMSMEQSMTMAGTQSVSISPGE